MHLEASNAHKESRSGKLLLLVVIAQNVADVLAEETLDALSELLHAVNVALIHLPICARAGSEGWDLFVHAVVERDVSHQVFDDGERFHRSNGDGFVQGERIHAGLAGKSRFAVDLGGARPTLAGFAVPADGQIGSLMRLHVMQSIKHDHARRDGYAGFHSSAAVAFAAKDFQCSLA